MKAHPTRQLDNRLQIGATSSQQWATWGIVPSYVGLFKVFQVEESQQLRAFLGLVGRLQAFCFDCCLGSSTWSGAPSFEAFEV